MTQSPAATGYTATVARSIDEVEALRGVFETVGGSNITTDLDFFLTLIEARPNVIRPHVVVLQRDGRPIAMLVARLERMGLPCRIGYRTLYEPIVRSITVMYDGFVGTSTDEAADAAIAALHTSLGEGEADVVFLSYLRIDSPLHRAALRDRSLRRQRGVEPTIHWRLDLPESLEAFLRSLSKGARTPLRRHANRFERDFAGQFELSFVRDPSDLETFVSDVVAVAEKTYQRQLGVAFEDTPFNRRVVQLTMERGQFRGYVLYVSGKPIAFWQGHAYGGVFYTTFTGFDPAYADYRVGTYLLMKAIDDLCGNSDVTAIDYGLGAAEWKERYGSESWYEADLILYSPGPRTLWINAARALTLTANRSAKRVASRTGAARRLKRGWRRRLAQS